MNKPVVVKFENGKFAARIIGKNKEFLYVARDKNESSGFYAWGIQYVVHAWVDSEEEAGSIADSYREDHDFGEPVE